jgi:hypothetical protein
MSVSTLMSDLLPPIALELRLEGESNAPTSRKGKRGAKKKENSHDRKVLKRLSC